MWVMGGYDRNNNPHSTTQIVTPTGPTIWGPNMTERVSSHCSTTLGDGSVIVTGGGMGGYGSTTVKIYNFTTGEWWRAMDMRQGRHVHSCAQVWLDPTEMLGIIDLTPSDDSVVSVVVAGGERQYCHTHIYITGFYTVSSVELYIPWNDTWVDLPILPIFTDIGGQRITLTKMLWLQSPVNGLYLLGGCVADDSCTRQVWRLQWAEDTQSYFWYSDSDLIPPLGTHTVYPQY